MKIQRQSERQFRQLISQKTGEEYSLSSVISDAFQSDEIFLSHEIIRPGFRSSGAHYHTETDEIIYVLSGTLKAVEGDTEIIMNEGDSIILEKGSGQYHYFKNESKADAQLLVIRKVVQASDVVFPTTTSPT